MIREQLEGGDGRIAKFPRQFSGLILAEAAERATEEIVGRIDAEEVYEELFVAVWQIIQDNQLSDLGVAASAGVLMEVKDNPKYRYERWFVEIGQRSRRGWSRLRVSQLLWSPTLREYVWGVEIDLGKATDDGSHFGNERGMNWIRENCGGARGVVNFFHLAVPEE